MAKSNRSNQAATSPDAALATLLDVDSSLAAQEATLRSQLEAVQEKRKSLESVIGIFSSTTAVKTAAKVESAPSQAVSASSKKSKTTPAKSAKQSTTQAKSAKSTKKTTQSAPKSTTQSAAKSTKSARSPETDQNWQRYVRQEFEAASLPEAVTNVLQSKPNGILGIPDIMDTIFLDQMPKDVRNKASNRISNILSTGLKANKWYRGKTGHYSVSPKVAMADLAS
jgi:hypothetical protein